MPPRALVLILSVSPNDDPNATKASSFQESDHGFLWARPPCAPSRSRRLVFPLVCVSSADFGSYPALQKWMGTRGVHLEGVRPILARRFRRRELCYACVLANTRVRPQAHIYCCSPERISIGARPFHWTIVYYSFCLLLSVALMCVAQIWLNL